MEDDTFQKVTFFKPAIFSFHQPKEKDVLNQLVFYK